MPMQYPLQITFTSEAVAYKRFHEFPPGSLDYVEGWSRKRDGASQVLLLRLASPEDLPRFVALCHAQPDVLSVVPITDSEFWAAPSNAI